MSIEDLKQLDHVVNILGHPSIELILCITKDPNLRRWITMNILLIANAAFLLLPLI